MGNLKQKTKGKPRGGEGNLPEHLKENLKGIWKEISKAR